MSSDTIRQVKGPAKTARWGWVILLVVSALLALNGLLFFFLGPQAVENTIEGLGQVPAEVVRLMAMNRQQVAIWYMAFGLLALLVAFEGFRHASRWAWNALWIMVAAMAAVGVLYVRGFGAYLLGLSAIALLALILARRGLADWVS
jgi:hypothetical protein